MERSVVFAGFGGQGILFAGHVLAEAANQAGLEVLWIPSYGPEMRGGTASVTVIVGDEPIGSPVVDRVDAAVVMNPPSLARYAPLVREGGLLIVNESLVEASGDRPDCLELRIPCTAIARLSGDDRLVSVVALGALIEHQPLVPTERIETAIHAIVGGSRPQIEAADLAAFQAGREAARGVSAG